MVSEINIENVQRIVSATIYYNYDWYLSNAIVVVMDGITIGSDVQKIQVKRLSAYDKVSTYIVSYLYV